MAIKPPPPVTGDGILIPDFELLDPNKKPRHRLVLAVDGREKQGKTHFALTAPGPIAYLDFDMGTEGVVEKFQAAGKVVIKSKPFNVRPPELAGGAQQAMAIGEQEWKRFKSSYYRVLSEPIARWQGKAAMARTLVVDTATEMYSLLRLAEFGQLTQISQFKYREVNSIMSDIVREAQSRDVNVIFIHKMGDEWLEGKDGKRNKSGTNERDGWDDMAPKVQANVICYRAPLPESIPVNWKFRCGKGAPHTWTAEARAEDSLGFRLRVLDSRHNPTLDGMELYDDQIDFALLASMIVEGTTSEDWK